MRVADIWTRIELGNRSREAHLTALDNVGAIGDEAGEMEILLGNHDADSLPLHGENGFDHMLDNLW